MREHPRLGKADAKYFVVELYNYNCPHCRVMDAYLEQAQRRYGGQLAILPLVVPLHANCNAYVKDVQAGTEHACEYARLALAVWESKPGEFETFHRWLIDSAPTPEAARSHAAQLVGADVLAKVLTEGSVDRRIEKHVRIYAAFGGGQIPKLIHGEHVARGEPASAQQLFSFLEKSVGVPPPP